MKLLYGTSNGAKLTTMREWLGSLGVELIGLTDMARPAPEVNENGRSPLDNARLKATAYYKEYSVPVFSCDSGLYFEGLPDAFQPGVHVRRVDGKRLNDEEMIEYYGALARKFGDLTARYWNAICFVKDPGHIYESMDESLSGEKFIITGSPSPKRVEGYPLDSLSVELETGRYYLDIEETRVSKDNTMSEGFRRLFQKWL